MTQFLPSRSDLNIYKAFMLIVFIHSLQSYNLVKVPFPWLAESLMVFLAFWLFAKNKFSRFPAQALLISFLIWSLIVTLINTLFSDFSSLFPKNTTTPYGLFIMLRIFKVFVFIACVSVFFYLLKKGFLETSLRHIALIGLVVSLYAIYIYVAQVYGLPEPPRNRMGTGGGEQSTTFSYAFHRAMGGFREPSHLAEWLIVPFFLSLTQKGAKNNLFSFIIGTALLLTGSLTGLLSIFSGLAVASFFSIKQFLQKLPGFYKAGLLILVSLFAFSFLVSKNEGGSSNIAEVLWDRVEPMLSEKGVSSSNRHFIYGFMEKNPIPLFGHGFGNSNIIFAQAMRFNALPSFLSLYFNIGYSLGLVGLVLLVLILIYPVFRILLKNKSLLHRDFIFIMAGYIAWLVVFSVHAEELYLPFALIYSIILYFSSKYINQNRTPQDGRPELSINQV